MGILAPYLRPCKVACVSIKYIPVKFVFRF